MFFTDNDDDDHHNNNNKKYKNRICGAQCAGKLYVLYVKDYE